MNSLSLLPLQPTILKAAIDSEVEKLTAQGMEPQEAVLKLEADFDTWLETDESNFPASLRGVLEQAEWREKSSQPPHRTYSLIVTSLAGAHTRNRREAALVVSQLQLILTLANEFRYSSAGIARIISQSERRIAVNWKLIEQILNRFGLRSELEESLVRLMQSEDKNRTRIDLGDANTDTIVEHLGFQANSVGLDDEFLEAVANLFTPSSGSPFIPYLQVLNYICSVANFFDHPPEYLYTFKPRGNVANTVFETFPPSLAPGGNPILNNFKAVDRITRDWSQSREDNREQAFALVRLIDGLSSLSYTPRIHLASAFRISILRYIEIKTPSDITIPRISDLDSLERFIRKVAESQTNTRGIVEQRITDFIAAMRHSLPDWRSRGLGDPVNATNRSSRKLGDSDFQHARERKCYAYEAHAGKLTDTYVAEHLRTLRLNLSHRVQEWNHISDLSEWDLTLCFVVHQDATSKDKPNIPGGFRSSIKITTFGSLLDEIKPLMEASPEVALDLFLQLVITPLNADNTPHSVKEVVTRLMRH